MAINKKNDFTEADLVMAEFAKALSHPARIAIVRILAEKNTCICGDLVEALPLAQSTVSQHLKALKEAGLIQGEIDGPRSCYCLDWKNLQKLWSRMQKLFSHLDKDHQRSCC